MHSSLHVRFINCSFFLVWTFGSLLFSISRMSCLGLQNNWAHGSLFFVLRWWVLFHPNTFFPSQGPHDQSTRFVPLFSFSCIYLSFFSHHLLSALLLEQCWTTFFCFPHHHRHPCLTIHHILCVAILLICVLSFLICILLDSKFLCCSGVFFPITFS